MSDPIAAASIKGAPYRMVGKTGLDDIRANDHH
jgi:hypothetical protein